MVSRQPFRFFRPALIFLSYPAKVARVIGVAPTLSFARQANVHAVGLHTQSGPPRCRAVLCRLRGDCITAMLAGIGARRHQVAPRLGLAPRSFRLTGERITLILPRNKKLVPTAGIAPAPSASQAAALSAELRGNKAKGTPAGSPDASNVTGAFPPKENWWRWRESHPLAQSCKDWPSL